MGSRANYEPLEAALDEYIALWESSWAEKTLRAYRAVFSEFLAWLRSTGRPMTTSSLDFETLLKFVGYLKERPAVRGQWRGNPGAMASAAERGSAPLSLNSVNSKMRSLRAFVLWLFEDGRLEANPYARKNRRGGQNPLLPTEETPTKGATLADIEALERGCQGKTPLDLRDQAIVALMKTTTARNAAIRLLRVEDVDLVANVVTFRRAKGNKTYEVALLPEAKAAIVRYLHRGRPKLLPRYPVRGFENIQLGEDPGYLLLARDNGRLDGVGPLTAGGLSDMVDRRYKAGRGTTAAFRSHRVRHGSATLLGNNGMPLEELRQLMGHSTTRTTLRYVKPTPESIGRYTEAALRNAGLAKGPKRAA